MGGRSGAAAKRLGPQRLQEFARADDGEIREGAVRDQPARTVSERFSDHLTLAIIAANVAAVAAVLVSVFTLR
jgi:hypothetical protein